MSPEPSTPIQEEAVRLHELFMSIIAAGFTENQAIKLLAEMLRQSKE